MDEPRFVFGVSGTVNPVSRKIRTLWRVRIWYNVEQQAAWEQMKVTITSFSFKRRLPEDKTRNRGVGMVRSFVNQYK